MDQTHILLIAATIAVGLAVVLRWIFAPRRPRRGPPPQAPRSAGADGAWNGTARRRRDLAT